MKPAIAITILALAALDLFFVWCCCHAAGMADDAEEQYLDADWYPEEMYDGDDA